MVAKGQHLATCGIYGSHSGARLGTRYLFGFKDTNAHIAAKGFRWRNEACRQEWLAALKEHHEQDDG